jgi:hypothetical protein
MKIRALTNQAGYGPWDGIRAWTPGSEEVIDGRNTALVEWVRAQAKLGNFEILEDVKSVTDDVAKSPTKKETADGKADSGRTDP